MLRPVLVMPVTNGKQMKRILELSGCYIPEKFRALLDRFGDNPAAMKQAGVVYATEQIIDLLAHGVDGIHIYSMMRAYRSFLALSDLDPQCAGYISVYGGTVQEGLGETRKTGDLKTTGDISAEGTEKGGSSLSADILHGMPISTPRIFEK